MTTNRISPRVLHGTAVYVTLALLAGTAWGKPRFVGQTRPGTIQDWQNRSKLAEEHLRAGDFKDTRDISDALLQEMLKRIEGGPKAGVILGQTLLLRALGEAGLGHLREAQWDWYSALAMNPALTEAELDAYGPPGKAIREALGRVEPKQPDSGTTFAEKDTGEGVTRPKKIKGKAPDYPLALSTACTQGTVMINTIVDREGFVRTPGPLKSPSPLLTLAALEAIRTWRFKPSMFRGAPVPVFYTLTVNFAKPTCTNPVAVATQKDGRE